MILDKLAAPFSSGGGGGGQRDTKWVDGLRGISAVMVATSHIIRSFKPDLTCPAADNGIPTIWHHPIIRLPAQGQFWLAIFFILSGYVNALKPIKLARSHKIPDALSNLATSAFRRTFRFVLPTTAATIFAWVVCNMGGYQIAKVSTSHWLNGSSCNPDGGFGLAINALFWNVFTTWSTGTNKYDPVQWSLTFLLKGSFMVFMALLATVNAQWEWRMGIFGGLYAFSWIKGDALVGINMWAGLLLAELSLLLPSRPFQTRLFSTVLPIFLLLLGGYLGSYPEFAPERRPWSKALQEFSPTIVPAGGEVWRFYAALGSHFFVLGCLFCVPLQRVLSHPYMLFLGKVSFPVYLLHAPLMRSLLTWLTFGVHVPALVMVTDSENKEGKWIRPEIPSPKLGIFFIAIPIFFAVLLTMCTFWVRNVDVWCGRFAGWAEGFAMGTTAPNREMMEALPTLNANTRVNGVV